jgi:hypothetical protein
MKGDFSRISFDSANRFSRVLLQQGRVTLDADPNEQSAILLHYLRALARDLIGPYGGPPDNLGFKLSVDSSAPPVMKISAGHYYVDGILCESDGCNYDKQPDYTPQPIGNNGQGDPLLMQLKAPNAQQKLWVYLDVWERHLSWIEDDRIREVALNGPDTSTRTKVVWQVRAQTLDAVVSALQAKKTRVDAQAGQASNTADKQKLNAQSQKLAEEIKLLQSGEIGRSSCAAPLDGLTRLSPPQMAARLDPGLQIKDPCVIAPDAQYRGAENQCYRVEIHRGGSSGTATFKWSRDNGSVATAWLSTSGKDLMVTNVRGFEVGNWVELSDDSNDLESTPGVMVKVVGVSPGKLTVDPGSASMPDVTQLNHPKVRRWDQVENDALTLTDGAILINTKAEQPYWIDLEDGIQVQFAPDGDYRCGDYWVFPARVATGSIDWPNTPSGQVTTWTLQPPHGVQHHYAPLGYLSWSAGGANGGGGFSITQCNCQLRPINACAQISNDTGVAAPAGTTATAATPTSNTATAATPARNDTTVATPARS